MATAKIQSGKRYGLALQVAGHRGYVDLDHAEATKLSKAAQLIFEVSNIEERFDVLFSNFIELERDLAIGTLENSYRSCGDYNQFWSEKLSYNRRMLNFLTTAKVYSDHTRTNFKRIFDRRHPSHSDLNKIFENQRCTSFSFLLMEALRNYAQHESLPVHGLKTGGRWIYMQTEFAEQISNTGIYLQVSELEYSRDFKRSFSGDFSFLEDKIDLKKETRKYVECLGVIHERIRMLVSVVEANARDAITEAMRDYYRRCPSEFGQLPLTLFSFEEGGHRERVETIFIEPMNYIDFIRSRHRNLSSVSKRSISTSHHEDSRKP